MVKMVSESISFLDSILEFLTTTGYANITLGHTVMILFGLALVFLAINRKYEPLILLPLGFTCILVNIPLAGIEEVGGFLYLIRTYLIDTEIIPILIFIGVGTMIDFSPMLSDPFRSLTIGVTAQIGIFIVFILSLGLGYAPAEAGSIGIIGSADGPTTIYAATILAPHLLGAVATSAYLYMALVPLIQPPIVYALTSQKERAVYMPPTKREVSKLEKMIFPIVLVLVGCLLVPKATPLLGAIAFGNLLRESRVVERLAKTAENELLNIATIFLGLGVGSTLTASSFLSVGSVLVLGLGVLGFVGGTIGGLMLGKLYYVLSHGKFNPVIGIAGVSAVPMSARVVQRIVSKANPSSHVLMYAMGPNVAGVLASASTAGILISILT